MAETELAPVKSCSKCGVEKPATTDWFDRHAECRFGVHSTCQNCQKGERYSERRLQKRKQCEDAALAGLRICSRCGIGKPATDESFFRSRSKLMAKCKQCVYALRRLAYERDVVAPREALREVLAANRRRCRDCREIKPKSGFYRQPDCRGGFRPECKACTVGQQSQAYYAKTIGRKRNTLKPYLDGEMRRCGRCGVAKPANRDFFNSHKSINGLSSWCRECLALKYQENKGRPSYRTTRKAAKANRNAKIRGKIGRITKADLLKMRVGQKSKCWWCQGPLGNYHVDHRFPIKHGGEHKLSNIVLSCGPCNLRKQAKMPWQIERPRLL